MFDVNNNSKFRRMQNIALLLLLMLLVVSQQLIVSFGLKSLKLSPHVLGHRLIIINDKYVL